MKIVYIDGGVEKIMIVILESIQQSISVTSWKYSIGDHRWLHDPAPPPDGDSDGGVADGNDHGWDDENGEGNQAEVQLPLPW